jgi:hypothetical protein
MTRTFKGWLTSLLAIALFTPISVLWFDNPSRFGFTTFSEASGARYNLPTFFCQFHSWRRPFLS